MMANDISRATYKTSLFFFVLVLSIHILLIILLPRKSATNQALIQATEPKLLVRLLPSQKVSDLNSKKIAPSTHKSLAKQHSSTVPLLSRNIPAHHAEKDIGQQAAEEKSTDSIHDTKHWAQEFSKLPDPSLKSSLRKKEFIAAPQTELQKFQENITESVRRDCKNAHSRLGLLAVPMLLLDLTKENGCKW